MRVRLGFVWYRFLCSSVTCSRSIHVRTGCLMVQITPYAMVVVRTSRRPCACS